MEATLVANTGPPAPPRPEARKQPTVHEELLAYVREAISAAGARRIVDELATARGLTVPRGGDPFARLDSFVLAHLNESDQRFVLERLRSVVRDLARRELQRRGTKKTATRSKNGTAGLNANAPARDKPNPQAKTRTRSIDKAISAMCSHPKCAVTLTSEERAFFGVRYDTYLGHGYCVEHAKLWSAVLTPSEQ
jgi:hypothetical protein